MPQRHEITALNDTNSSIWPYKWKSASEEITEFIYVEEEDVEDEEEGKEEGEEEEAETRFLNQTTGSLRLADDSGSNGAGNWRSP